MKLESTLSSVVLPAPVPPLIRQFSRARTQCDRKSSIGRVSARSVTRSSAFSRSAGNRRIESSGPSTASGGMIALTREPSARRASTIGELSSIAAADAADDAIDDAQQVLVVLERGACTRSSTPLALDEDVLVRVDQDVADGRVAQQRLERTQAEDVVEELGEQRLALGQADRRRSPRRAARRTAMRISLSARDRSACASASRFRRFSSLR